MNDEEISLLKALVDSREKARQVMPGATVLWIPGDGEPAHEVLSVGAHAEEGDLTPCAIFHHGKYVALYGVELSQFYLASPIGVHPLLKRQMPQS